MTTKSPDTPGFKSNSITATHTLKKVGDKWLLNATAVEDVKFL